jgi:hypothetical protein
MRMQVAPQGQRVRTRSAGEYGLTALRQLAQTKPTEQYNAELIQSFFDTDDREGV